MRTTEREPVEKKWGEILTDKTANTQAEEAVAYTSSEITALNYTAQMNEKGFIEP